MEAAPSCVLSVDKDTCGLLALSPRLAKARPGSHYCGCARRRERKTCSAVRLAVGYLFVLGNAQCINADGCGWLRASADRDGLLFLFPAFPVQVSSQKDLVAALTSQLTYEDHVCLSAVLLTILHDSDKVLNAPDNNQNVLALCKVALQLYIRVACAQDLLNSLCIVLAVCARAALLASFDNVIGMSKYLVL